MSFLWLGGGGLFFGFVFLLAIEFARGNSLKEALKSWPPYFSAFLAFVFVWLCLFIYSIADVLRNDHESLVFLRVSQDHQKQVVSPSICVTEAQAGTSKLKPRAATNPVATNPTPNRFPPISQATNGPQVPLTSHPPTSTTSVAPTPSFPLPQPQRPSAASIIADIDRMQQRLNSIDLSWSGGERRIAQDFITPYRYQRDRVIPQTMSAELQQRFADLDNETTADYGNLLPELNRIRIEAINHLDPVPNEITKDNSLFQEANRKAATKMKIAEYAKPPIMSVNAPSPRFSGVNDYLNQLKKKVGDTH